MSITIWQPGMNPALPRTTFYKDTGLKMLEAAAINGKE
jgi:hypothetical protein